MTENPAKDDLLERLAKGKEMQENIDNIIGDKPEGLAAKMKYDFDKYFITNEKGKTTFVYSAMIEDILSNFQLVTFTDTEEMWVYHEEDGFYRDTAVAEVKAFICNNLSLLFKKSYAEECIYQIKVRTLIHREKMEPEPNLLNLENGILDLNTYTLIPHTDRRFFISRLPTIYAPDAEASLFMELLGKIECAKIDTLQEFCGYLLEDTAKYKKAGFLYGPTDTGKSTFTRAITDVLGPENLCSVPIQRLDKRFQIQRLYKRKANVVADLGSEAFSSVAIFRQTTGGDNIEAEVKGSNKTMNFRWGGKHLFDANDLPKATGDADTDAFYNRLHLFAFTYVFEKDEIDRDYGEKLSTPEERSGILNWMIKGLQRLEKNKRFTDQTSIEEIRTYYKRASDTVYCFAEDRCEIILNSFVSKAESRTKYLEYCIEQKFSPIGKGKFYEELHTQLPAIVTERQKIGNETPQVWMNLSIYGAENRTKGHNPDEGQGKLT